MNEKFKKVLKAEPASTGLDGKLKDTTDDGAGRAILIAAKLLTRLQIAHRYQVSLRCVDNWSEDGRIPKYKVGHLVRYDPIECDKALRAFWFPSRSS